MRSPTAAIVLQREFGYNTRSAGINDEYALITVDEVLLNWADEIVVMETWMAHELEKDWGDIVCLNIPDKFPYMDPELQTLIVTKYKELLDK